MDERGGLADRAIGEAVHRMWMPLAGCAVFVVPAGALCVAALLVVLPLVAAGMLVPGERVVFYLVVGTSGGVAARFLARSVLLARRARVEPDAAVAAVEAQVWIWLAMAPFAVGTPLVMLVGVLLPGQIVEMAQSLLEW